VMAQIVIVMFFMEIVMSYIEKELDLDGMAIKDIMPLMAQYAGCLNAVLVIEEDFSDYTGRPYTKVCIRYESRGPKYNVSYNSRHKNDNVVCHHNLEINEAVNLVNELHSFGYTNVVMAQED